MTEIKRATKYVRDGSGRVVLQRNSSSSITPDIIQQRRLTDLVQKKHTQTPTLQSAEKKKGQKQNPVQSVLYTAIQTIATAFKTMTVAKKVGAATVFTVLCCILIFLFFNARVDKSIPSNAHPSGSNTPVENLEYQTVLPNGKSISGLGGWRRVSPPEADPVYAYTDTIAGIEVNVSQQPIPGSFIGNVNSGVAKLAKEYNATNSINAKDTKVYIGVSSKGPQSVIFTKNNLLILIKSRNKIADKDWIIYIDSLN